MFFKVSDVVFQDSWYFGEVVYNFLQKQTQKLRWLFFFNEDPGLRRWTFRTRNCPCEWGRRPNGTDELNPGKGRRGLNVCANGLHLCEAAICWVSAFVQHYCQGIKTYVHKLPPSCYFDARQVLHELCLSGFFSCSTAGRFGYHFSCSIAFFSVLHCMYPVVCFLFKITYNLKLCVVFFLMK